MKTRATIFVFALSLLSACTYADDLTQRPDPEENPSMARVVTPITPIIKPNSLVPGDVDANVYPPEPGSTTLANDISPSLQTIQDQVFTLVDVKVNRAGDTMTGSLTITPASSGNALVVNAETTSKGVQINGSTNEPALEINGGTATNALQIVSASSDYAIDIENGGSGGSAHFQADPTGMDGVVVLQNATAATGLVPRGGLSLDGAIVMTGASPNATVNPGADNALFGANIPKAWVTVSSAIAILDGYNIASVTTFAPNEYRVTFARPMANTNYAVTINVHGAPGYAGSLNAVKTTTHFHFNIWKTDAPGTLGFGLATEAAIKVMARQ